jgi:flagellar P-ring protein precursor FlgI
MKSLLALLAAALAALLATVPACAVEADGVRIKDLGRIDGIRENQLVGYGLVTGLAGSGDSSRSRATRQSLANLLYQFDLNVGADQIQSRNVAIVMVTATLPAFSRPGDKLDVTVTSIGDARSLLGGSLLLTPLKGPDNKVHALAQGALAVGGYKYDLSGNLVQKNHPTVGMIPGGANIEVGTHADILTATGTLLFVLSDADYTTASRIAEAINRAPALGASAHPVDASTIEVTPGPDGRNHLVSFMTGLENLVVSPDAPARVVVNERTGTVISGGDVRISKVTISHGDLKVSVVNDQYVSQPLVFGRGSAGVRTEVVPRVRIGVAEDTGPEEGGGNVILESSSTVADLVRALNKIKTSPRDMISILQGIKAAGALHAELMIR